MEQPRAAGAGCADGAHPISGLVLASNGDFCGTTQNGGAYSLGTVYKITSNGVLTALHSFSGKDGANPYASLIQAADGNLYGTTVFSLSVGLGLRETATRLRQDERDRRNPGYQSHRRNQRHL